MFRSYLVTMRFVPVITTPDKTRRILNNLIIDQELNAEHEDDGAVVCWDIELARAMHSLAIQCGPDIAIASTVGQVIATPYQKVNALGVQIFTRINTASDVYKQAPEMKRAIEKAVDAGRMPAIVLENWEAGRVVE